MSQATTFQHYIDGRFTSGQSSDTIERINPANGQVTSVYAAGTKEDANLAVEVAQASFEAKIWSNSSSAERQRVLAETAGLIRQNKEELAQLEHAETGKPIAQARDEMDWAAGIWDYASGLCRHLHGDSMNNLGDDLLGMTLREAIGVVGIITPWNFPLLILSQKLPFALAAGCSCVVKPSEMSSGTSLKVAEYLSQAGLPKGVCNMVTGYGDPVGVVFSSHPAIQMVSFTGSTAVGKHIQRTAADHLKKVSLELGGKNPQLVLEDADIKTAANAIAHGAFFNMGECCNSGSRVIVVESVADQLVAEIIANTKNIITGDPTQEQTQVGAIISPEHKNKILAAIQGATEQGAACVCREPQNLPSQGDYVALHVLDHVSADMDIAKDEVFGPVLSIIRCKNKEEAVHIANNTEYGLSASVWSENFKTAMSTMRELHAGTVWINTFLDGAPELPFGGYKASGLGRELGPDSVLEYTETKTVTMRTGTPSLKWC